jgi:prepilin-type N-terminal cleavage/methylation domain-containing protein
MLKCLNDKSGFTMIELLIVMVIIGIVAAITLPSYNKARNNKDLLLGREQVSGDIRMAQNYSFNTLKFGAAFPEGGYGIHFDIGDPKKYIIFADKGLVPNQTYDAGEKFQELELPRSVEISSLKVDGSDVSPVDVVFKPPYGKVFIALVGTKLEIKIKNDDGETRIIEVENSGLIN